MLNGIMTTPQINADGPAQTLKDRFTRLWERCLIDGVTSDPDPVWETLDRLYTEPHRHSHDVSHLEHCLLELDPVREGLDRPDQVEMALWFHDAVHHSNQSDNEARSAELFSTMAEGVMIVASVATIADLITVTTHKDPPETEDQQYICDIDMSSFGAPWERFLQDSMNLKKEFLGPVEDYYSRKRRFFESLLQRPRVFYTEHFYNRYGEKARRNIRRTLKLVEEGSGGL